jgi:hypothetical protein
MVTCTSDRGVKLHQTLRHRKKHHLFVSDRRDTSTVCNEISDSLVEFLRQRFSIDKVVTSQLVDFVRFDVEKTDLRDVHSAIGADLDIAELTLEFAELARSSNQMIKKPLPELVVRCLSNSQ